MPFRHSGQGTLCVLIKSVKLCYQDISRLHQSYCTIQSTKRTVQTDDVFGEPLTFSVPIYWNLTLQNQDKEGHAVSPLKRLKRTLSSSDCGNHEARVCPWVLCTRWTQTQLHYGLTRFCT